MPVYLFTYHTYGSWMPDRSQGYTHKTSGVRKPDSAMADQYRTMQRQAGVALNENQQRQVIEEIIRAAKHQGFILYAIATDPTHIHVLCGWEGESAWSKFRNGIRQSITRMLNRDFGRKRWLAENASRKCVTDEMHFEHLRNNYLPDHRGLKWDSEKGYYN